jgi:hypothetical protein
MFTINNPAIKMYMSSLFNRIIIHKERRPHKAASKLTMGFIYME